MEGEKSHRKGKLVMDTSKSKALILENLRAASVNENGKRKLERSFFQPKISTDYRELKKEFIVNLEMVSGLVIPLKKKDELKGKIRDLMAEFKAESVCFWNEKLMKSLEITPSEDPVTADIGITGADFGIAETGTLVLLSSPEKPRLTSLLPPIHISILEKENILPDIHTLFATLKENFSDPENLCSCVSFITGPSRTADIELNLTLGVHGPEKTITIII